MQVILLATDEQPPPPPLSETLPAAMVPIVERPVLATTIEILARAGRKQILVSLCERGGQIASYFGDGRRWGVDITYLTQRKALGTAGALRFAGGLLSESFLVMPGGSLIDLDLDAALAFHRSHGGLATVVLHTAERGPGQTMVRVEADGRVLGEEQHEQAGTSLSATGAYIFEPGVLAYIPWGERCDIAGDLLPALIDAGERVYGYTMKGYWNPLSSIAEFQEAQEVYLYSAYRQRVPDQDVDGPPDQVRYPSLDARQIAPGIWVGREPSIHPSVKIAPPTYIGAHCWIGREAELGPETVVGANVVIDDEATVDGSTVLGNTYIGRLVHVSRRVVTATTISDVETNDTIRVVDPFLIGPMGLSAGGPNLIGRALSSLTALALIVLLSPLLLLTAVLSLAATGGILVRSPRVGHRSTTSAALRRFTILQFRTRRSGQEPNALGRLIERWELHRLAELFNVLLGELALVGVKPLTLEEAEQLSEEWHQRRHERPAGFTGLWYLQTDPDSPLDAVIVADVYYCATRTWRGDLLCLLRTPGAWLRRGRSTPKSRDEQEYVVQVG